MDGMNDLSIMMLFFDYLASSTQDVHFNFVVVDELSCRYNVASHNGKPDYGGIGTIVLELNQPSLFASTLTRVLSPQQTDKGR